MEILFENIGAVVFKKSPRAKRVSIRMKPFAKITVTVPVNVSYESAKKFVIEKQNWIIKHLKTIAEQEKRLTIFTTDTKFKTLKHRLIIESWNKDSILTRVENGVIKIKYPENANIETEQIQNAIRKAIERALGKEAQEYLLLRIAFLARKLGFKYRSVTINNLKTRWGACSRDNQISLNLHLMRLPSRLIDYVIIHELCHTKEKNHGVKFWKLMERVLKNAKLLDKELKKYNTKIY